MPHWHALELILFYLLAPILGMHIPPSPCKDYFGYYEQNGEIFGSVRFKNDFSGEYLLVINMTVPLVTNQNIKLKMTSLENNVRNGGDLEYQVLFPYNGVIPYLTSLTFNGKVKCVGLNDVDRRRGSTMLSVYNFYKTDASQVSNTRLPLSVQNAISENNINNNIYLHPKSTSTRASPLWNNIVPESTTNNFINAQQLSGNVNLPIEGAQEGILENLDPLWQFIGVPSTTNRFNLGNNNHKVPISNLSPTTEINKQNYFSQCGLIDDFKPLIVGGTPTKSGEFPWLVAIFYVEKEDTYKFRCAGSLITDKHVITAAHCVKYRGVEVVKKENMLLVLGKHNIKSWATRSVIRDVKTINIHPEFYQPGDADIAVVTLEENVPFKENIRPVCLWEGDNNIDGIVNKMGTVAGWGKDESKNDYVSEPRKIDMPVVSQEECLRSDDRFLQITSNRTFCAGDKTGASPCSGDSGGGFLMRKQGKWYLRGIVSVALSDPKTLSCDTHNYIVFSDVSKYSEWIRNILNKPI